MRWRHEILFAHMAAGMWGGLSPQLLHTKRLKGVLKDLLKGFAGGAAQVRSSLVW